MDYTNPRMHVQIDDWPYGHNMRTSATFTVESDPKRGERAGRITVDPRLGRANAPHKLPYARRVCFVDGDDGRLYILQDTATHYSIMKSTMAHTHATVYPQDRDQFAALTALFEARAGLPGFTEEPAPLKGEAAPTSSRSPDQHARCASYLLGGNGDSTAATPPPAPEDASPVLAVEPTDSPPATAPAVAEAVSSTDARTPSSTLSARQYGFLDALALDGVYTHCPAKVRAAFVKKGLTTDLSDTATVTELGRAALRAYACRPPA